MNSRVTSTYGKIHESVTPLKFITLQIPCLMMYNIMVIMLDVRDKVHYNDHYRVSGKRRWARA